MKKIISLFILFCLSLSVSLQEIYARHGDDDGDRHHGSSRGYYRHYRNYPHEFYYHRKIYFSPYRTYYYYYDVYPEKIQYYGREQDIVASNPAYLPVTSIANMVSQGVPDAVIIEEIKRTNSVYRLDAGTITYLKQNGASDEVIDFMLATEKN